MDRQIYLSTPFSLCCGNLSAILRGYIGSLTYFYQHFPIPPLGQIQHPFEGQGRKICCLPVCCPLHVSSRGHYSMGSVIHTHRHKNAFIDTYNTHGFSTCMRIQHKLFQMHFCLVDKQNFIILCPCILQLRLGFSWKQLWRVYSQGVRQRDRWIENQFKIVLCCFYTT